MLVDLRRKRVGISSKISTGYTQGSNPYNIRVFKQNSQITVNNVKIIHSLKNGPVSMGFSMLVDEMWKEIITENRMKDIKGKSEIIRKRKSEKEIEFLFRSEKRICQCEKRKMYIPDCFPQAEGVEKPDFMKRKKPESVDFQCSPVFHKGCGK